MIKKNHVCRECGRSFSHARRLLAHRFDTGHGVDRVKTTAKRLAKSAGRSIRPPVVKRGEPPMTTRAGVLAWIKRKGLAAVRRRIRNG